MKSKSIYKVMDGWKKYLPADRQLVIPEEVIAHWVVESPGRTDVVILTEMSNIHHIRVISVFPVRITLGDNEFIDSVMVNRPLSASAATIARAARFGVLSSYSTTSTRPKVADILEFVHALVAVQKTN